jgi:predicted small lipoprotein YifL
MEAATASSQPKLAIRTLKIDDDFAGVFELYCQNIADSVVVNIGITVIQQFFQLFQGLVVPLLILYFRHLFSGVVTSVHGVYFVYRYSTIMEFLMKIRFTAVLLLISLFTLSACGQKGPLYLEKSSGVKAANPDQSSAKESTEEVEDKAKDKD